MYLYTYFYVFCMHCWARIMDGFLIDLHKNVLPPSSPSPHVEFNLECAKKKISRTIESVYVGSLRTPLWPSVIGLHLFKYHRAENWIMINLWFFVSKLMCCVNGDCIYGPHHLSQCLHTHVHWSRLQDALDNRVVFLRNRIYINSNITYILYNVINLYKYKKKNS